MIIKKSIGILLNNIYDGISFIRYSSLYNHNALGKIEGKLSYYYHSIEKGLINENIRYKFGAAKVERLIYYLNLWLKRNYNTNRTQFISACSVLVKYYDLHKSNNIDISEILSDWDYSKFKTYFKDEAGGVINFNKDSYFKNSRSNFDVFSDSRHSVRNFSGRKITHSEIEKAINLARNTPSVCNRQSVLVRFVDNEEISKKVIRIQGGLNSALDSVNQIFVVTSNRNFFVSASERNQMHIDGGLFLLNLLYSLHFHHIAACPLHGALHYHYERKIKNLLSIKPQEKIIAFIAVGYPADEFKIPISFRKANNEILEFIS